MLTIAPLVLILDLPWSTYYEYPGLNYHQEDSDNHLPKPLVKALHFNPCIASCLKDDKGLNAIIKNLRQFKRLINI